MLDYFSLNLKNNYLNSNVECLMYDLYVFIVCCRTTRIISGDPPSSPRPSKPVNAIWHEAHIELVGTYGEQDNFF